MKKKKEKMLKLRTKSKTEKDFVSSFEILKLFFLEYILSRFQRRSFNHQKEREKKLRFEIKEFNLFDI